MCSSPQKIGNFGFQAFQASFQDSEVFVVLKMSDKKSMPEKLEKK